ncbi:MAG: hypothetical protein WBA51_01420 [Erythrobacter sp.]
MTDMTGIISIVALLGWLILAGSAFASFQLSWGKTLQLMLVWAAIFLGGLLLVRLLGLEL